MPKFNQHDSAIIERMIVIPFLAPHERDDEKAKQPDDIVNELRPEFPAIIRLLAEYYVKLKYERKGKIPVSKESESYKDSYIAELETDIDKYIRECLVFEKGAVEKIATVYEHFLNYYEVGDVSSKSAGVSGRTSFTRFIKKYYGETITVTPRRVHGKIARCFIGARIKTPEEMEAYASRDTERGTGKPEIPAEENPFD
jgi:phage/plasmid-associated DNA primase